MKKKSLILVLLIVMDLMIVLCSCKTYVPVTQPIDITIDVQILTDKRPDNNKLDIITEVVTPYDILHNSKEYMYAWEQWENYALSLEAFIGSLSSRLNTL